ncbi:hypothetical protein [Blastococcus sp. SYSU D00813]
MLPAVLGSLLVLPWLVTAGSSARGTRALPVSRWTSAPVPVPHRTPTHPDDWVLLVR